MQTSQQVQGIENIQSWIIDQGSIIFAIDSTRNRLSGSVSFEQIGESPHDTMEISNPGDSSIQSVSVQLAGQNMPFTWSPAFPVQPGQTVMGTSIAMTPGLVLVVGTVYTLCVTAAYPDGSSDSQTLNVIYSLNAGLGL